MSDDALAEYLARRDLDVSGEPGGGEPGDRPRFVIQRHDASSLHFDVRLEVDGVLKSWAVPKGPSTDPRDKRLAAPTEDHPLDYADFEGRIPAGEYGGGTVIVWDTGPYLADDDQWLLVKVDDAGAYRRRKPTTTELRSVLSGRTNEDLEDEAAEQG